MCVDFTCTNTLQEATVIGCAEDGLYVVQKAHERNLSMDTFGSWHKETLGLITQLGRALARSVDREDEEQVRHLRQRLGITLVCDNMAMLLARRPTFVASNVDMHLDC